MRMLNNWFMMGPCVHAHHPTKPNDTILTSAVQTLNGKIITTRSGSQYQLGEPARNGEWELLKAILPNDR